MWWWWWWCCCCSCWCWLRRNDFRLPSPLDLSPSLPLAGVLSLLPSCDVRLTTTWPQWRTSSRTSRSATSPLYCKCGVGVVLVFAVLCIPYGMSSTRIEYTDICVLCWRTDCLSSSTLRSLAEIEGIRVATATKTPRRCSKKCVRLSAACSRA